MKYLLTGLVLIVGVSCQIYTQVGPDGYKYPKPIARFNLPEPEPACSNGGKGEFCCTNGANNVDCCSNGGSGPDCCTNGGRGAYCCENGANNPDCCDNGGRGQYCCTNGASTPDCSVPTSPKPQPLCSNGALDSSYPDCCTNGGRGVFCCENGADNSDCCENGGRGQYCCTNGADVEGCIIPEPVQDIEEEIIPLTPPPLPSFIPSFNLPKIIPVVKPIETSPPTPFSPRLPVKPVIEVEARFQSTTKSPNEYLPPLDVRSGFLPDFEEWKAKYRKRYASPEEEKKRRVIFQDNMKVIVNHNLEFEAGLVSYDCDINFFGDLTSDEFLNTHTGLKRDSRSAAGGHSSMNVFMPSPMLEAMTEDEVDWREKGAVTPVKNQGSCASCWAFAANGALEAQNFLKTGKLVSLSEQNLIDCVKENDGCDGGYMTNAYDYVRTNPGVDTESSYPYEAKNSTCRFDPANVGGECMAHMEIMIGNEKALKQAVATVGPVAAGIDGSKKSFQFYKSGFYFEPTCDTEVNHAVLIVGYGKTEDGQEYWICKNSWDTDWGEEGYIRMARNKNNHCGITSLASYPLV